MDQRQQDLKSMRTGDDPADLAQVIANLPVPLTLADLKQDGAPIYAANPAFLELSGYPEDQVIGRNCRFLQAGLDNVEARAEIRTAINEKRRTQVILQNKTRQGVPFQNFLTLIPVFEKNSEEEFVLGTQFALTTDEAAQLDEIGCIVEETVLSNSLSRARSVSFERRRVMIDAAVRMVQSAMILRQLSRA